jgi:undecaprenyl diphosphate synthase
MKPENNIPRHVAIIPDGNRRWAKAHGLPASEGHMMGYQRINEISEAAREMGIQTMTIWGFSTENWSRDDNEVRQLFKIFMKGLRIIAREARKHNIRIRHLGRKDRLPSIVISYLKRLEDATAKHEGYQLNLALDYGGRDEILRAVRKMMSDGVLPTEVSEDLFSSYLDTGDSPDPDLIIRTSGELRMSGLLPWQGTYAEYYFTPLPLPEFTADEFRKAINEYSQRDRRYGGNTPATPAIAV